MLALKNYDKILIKISSGVEWYSELPSENFRRNTKNSRTSFLKSLKDKLTFGCTKFVRRMDGKTTNSSVVFTIESFNTDSNFATSKISCALCGLWEWICGIYTD